jgi:pimeloyl-ACP methyl ester carboxylesterase
MPVRFDESRVSHHDANVGEVRLHYVQAGPPNGPLVVLLHGFPDFWYVWRNQITALAAAGYRVVAPDLRGFNLSDKPTRVSDYGMAHLTSDVAGLVRACGASRATVVGHDWGGAVAWAFAMQNPDAVERLVVLNCPHPAAFQHAVATSPSQMRRSWYMFFFQLPVLPEWLISGGDFALWRRTMRRVYANPGAFTETDVARYIEAFRQPGAVTSGINYYRAGFREFRRSRTGYRVVAAPTMMIWGEGELYLNRELAELPREWVPDARIERVPRACHWVQADAPDRVNELLLDFFATARPADTTSASA